MSEFRTYDEGVRNGTGDLKIVVRNGGKSGQTINVTVRVRREREGDIKDIYNINLLAFGREDEGRLVERLRNEVSPFILR